MHSIHAAIVRFALRFPMFGFVSESAPHTERDVNTHRHDRCVWTLGVGDSVELANTVHGLTTMEALLEGVERSRDG